MPSALRLVVLLSLATGCQDVRDFEGQWIGGPATFEEPLLTGFTPDDFATLFLQEVEVDEIRGGLSTSAGTFQSAAIEPLAAAQADVLSDISFAGSPLKVFVSFATPTDGAGDALIFTAIYPEERIELRVLRGRPIPLYGIFDLRRAAP